MLTFDQINRLTGGRIGTFDAPCPICGPERRSPANQRRKVLRIWRIAPGFATFRCARCDLHGFARDSEAAKPEAAELAKARAEARRFGEAAAEQRRRRARWLWSIRRPAPGSPVETYLRLARRYSGPLPPTIGFLPPRGELAAAMISAFGIYADFETVVAPESVQGVHITRLAPDGCGKAGTDADKIMLGTPRGTPIVLAPPNDGLGLAITEGVEDGLSIFEATGLGAWAAGSASFLPTLADAIPSYVEFVNVVADPDDAGRRFARELALRLRKRDIRYRLDDRFHETCHIT
jgi:hypothetical protein